MLIASTLRIGNAKVRVARLLGIHVGLQIYWNKIYQIKRCRIDAFDKIRDRGDKKLSDHVACEKEMQEIWESSPLFW